MPDPPLHLVVARDPTARVVEVQIVEPDGFFILEIEGSSANPLIHQDDIAMDLEAVVSEAVREALDIPKGVPLILNITTPTERQSFQV